MHDDRAVEAGDHVGRVCVRIARNDDDGLAELGGELELRLEEAALLVARARSWEVTEARLPMATARIVLGGGRDELSDGPRSAARPSPA